MAHRARLWAGEALPETWAGRRKLILGRRSDTSSGHQACTRILGMAFTAGGARDKSEAN